MAEAFGVSASALAVAELSAKVITLCFRYSQDVRHAKKDIERVIDEVRNMERLATDLRALLDTDQRTKLESLGRLEGSLSDLQSKLNDLHDKLAPRYTQRVMGRLGIRALKWPFESKDVEKILGGFTSCIQLLTTALQLDQTRATHTIENDLQKLVLDKLPIAAGATFDSHAEEYNATCLPGTREALLDKISRWTSDSNSGAKPVFWLNGMAGTGNSTISHTLARSFHRTGQLGASFFFKRGEGDRGGASKFFTTIATQLVRQNPGLTSHVKKAIDEDNDIAHKSLKIQFEKLILTPLSSTSLPVPKVLVLVVDALDECERTEDAEQIIKILLHANKPTSWRLRVFLTSRPELHIRLGFSRVQGAYEDLILHEMEESVIERDFAVYFKHQLASIRDDYNKDASQEQQLSLHWPDPSEVKILIEIAMPLFIFAATSCRFIGESRLGHPKKQLQKILEHRTKSQGSKLDATYLPVLDQLLAGLSESEKSKVLDLFKHLVGSIVILESPLSASALASLLDIPQDDINSHLRLLHSVLSIPPSPRDPIRLLHLSFRDFLVDSSKSSKSPFWVDEKEAHKRLAADCICLLNKTLRKDICNLEWPGTKVKSIDPQTISDALPIEAQYACRYWVYHLEQADDFLSDDDQTHRFLKQHFLHWLEAMILISKLYAAKGGLQTLRSLCQSEASSELSQFLSDGINFISNSRCNKPLQYYIFPLLFAQKRSVIRNTFQNDIPEWVSLAKGHTGTVWQIRFSPDGLTIATGSFDTTARLWSVATGTCLQTLEGHTRVINSVAFSPNGLIIATSSFDDTVRLWSVATGICLQTLGGHTEIISSVVFSPNGLIIAVGSRDKTVQLWSVATGDCLKKISIGVYPTDSILNGICRSPLVTTGTASLNGPPESASVSHLSTRERLGALPQSPSDHIHNHDLLYEVCVDPTRWIKLNGRNWIYCPNRNTKIMAVSGSTVVLTGDRGNFLILRIPEKHVRMSLSLGRP